MNVLSLAGLISCNIKLKKRITIWQIRLIKERWITMTALGSGILSSHEIIFIPTGCADARAVRLDHYIQT